MGLFNIFNKSTPPPEQPPAPKAKVLVVDDEQYLRDFYHELLFGEGYEVYTATNGQEALDIISKNPPNVILLDIMMPVMDGNKVLEKLWTNQITKKIPVLVLTNAGDINNMDKAKFYSAYKFFIKANVTPEEIIQTVAEALKVHPTMSSTNTSANIG